LELNNISKNFGGVVALDQAVFRCNKGEVHGLVGQNGAGKSTLVKILSGVVERDAGEIVIDGQPYIVGDPADAMEAGVGMVFQELSQIPELRVSQNIFLGLEEPDKLGGTSLKDLRTRSYDLFDQMGIDVADPDRPINELPLSQRQMVEIAKVVARDPRVIIFDEASSALGREQASWLIGYCRGLAAKGKIIIFISHKLSEIREVADRITVFRNGANVGTFGSEDRSVNEIVNLMLGRVMGRLYPPREADISLEPILVVRDLSTGARLKGIDLTLQKGEILGVGGLTGQGQDELFRALYGVQHSTGEVLLDVQAVRIKSPSDALGLGIALVPEDRATQGLLFPKSVADNITLSVLSKLLNFGFINRVAEREVIGRALDRFSIMVPDPDDPVERLSGGNQQKVVLAKLLATQPKVLMMFDSTRGVDVGTKAEIYALLRELAAGGSAVLWYSTDNDELINMCDRVLVMRQGQVEADLSGDLITEENIVRAAVGEAIQANNHEQQGPLVGGNGTATQASQPGALSAAPDHDVEDTGGSQDG
jgi:ribose transport system ATP-binding protein